MNPSAITMHQSRNSTIRATSLPIIGVLLFVAARLMPNDGGNWWIASFVTTCWSLTCIVVGIIAVSITRRTLQLDGTRVSVTVRGAHNATSIDLAQVISFEAVRIVGRSAVIPYYYAKLVDNAGRPFRLELYFYAPEDRAKLLPALTVLLGRTDVAKAGPIDALMNYWFGATFGGLS